MIKYFPSSQNVCIRQEAGFCCIEYNTCSDPNSFAIHNDDADSLIATYCTEDYLEISGVMQSCQAPNVVLYDKLCGGKFAAVEMSTVIANPVCGNDFYL